MAWNEEKNLPAVLNDILAQGYPHEKIELLLIDSMSDITRVVYFHKIIVYLLFGFRFQNCLDDLFLMLFIFLVTKMLSKERTDLRLSLICFRSYSEAAETLSFGLHKRINESEAHFDYRKVQMPIKNAVDCRILFDLENLLAVDKKNISYFLLYYHSSRSPKSFT